MAIHDEVVAKRELDQPLLPVWVLDVNVKTSTGWNETMNLALDTLVLVLQCLARNKGGGIDHLRREANTSYGEGEEQPTDNDCGGEGEEDHSKISPRRPFQAAALDAMRVRTRCLHAK